MKVFRFFLSVSLVVFLFLISGCKDPADPKPPKLPEPPIPKVVDVFIGGKYFDESVNGGTWIPAYWKNGELVKLSDEVGNVSIITTNETGSDVYALCEYPEEAFLWKNGIRKELPGINNMAVEIRGDDVYITGRIKGPDYNNRISIWKNDDIIADVGNPLASNFVYDLEIASNDIYAGGYDGTDDGFEAVFWKNGVKKVLPHEASARYSTIRAIKALGNDLFAVGINNGLGVWKNNVFSAVGAKWDEVYSNNCLAVDGDDIYVCGARFDEDADSRHAAYWKNGEIVKLDPSEINSKAFAIFVANDIVYILGEIDGETVLWKNGAITEPFDRNPNISASCLFVLVH